MQFFFQDLWRESTRLVEVLGTKLVLVSDED